MCGFQGVEPKVIDLFPGLIVVTEGVQYFLAIKDGLISVQGSFLIVRNYPHYPDIEIDAVSHYFFDSGIPWVLVFPQTLVPEVLFGNF